MAKAPSLRKDWTKGTQRTRKLSTGNALWRLRKWEGTLRGASGSRRKIAGVKPGAVKAASPVLNGGDEETGLCRPRLVATQLECGDFFYGEWGGAIVLYNHLMPRPSSSLLSINISYELVASFLSCRHGD